MSRFGLIVFPVVVALSLGLVSGCARTHKDGAKSPKAPEKAAQVPVEAPQFHVQSRGIKELSWQVGGKYIMRASAKSLTADESTGKAELKQARASIYKDGKEVAVITADSIQADSKSGVLTATGGIVAKSLIRDARATVGKLTWTHSDQRIVGTGGVRMESDAGDVVADRFVANTELSEIRLHANSGGRASVSVSALE